MLGFVVRAVHLPLGPRLRNPGWSPKPSVRRSRPSPLRWTQAVRERPPLCPGSGCSAQTPPTGALSRGALSPRPSLSPTPASSLGASRDPRMGRGRGRVSLGTKEGLHPAIPQPQPNPGRWGQWRFQNFYVSFRGRHLVGRGLKCLCCSRFSKHWTPDCSCPRK